MPAPTDQMSRLDELNEIGVALCKEKDITRLVEKILVAAQTITNADGGTLYRVDDDGNCRFEILRTDSLGLAMGGTTGVPIPYAPIRLLRQDGSANETMVVAYAVLREQTVNLQDAYDAPGFDFSGTKAFDAQTGYRSKSFLTVPLKNHEDEIIGVLQLINARDRKTGAIVPFSPADQRLAESLAAQAAIALTNRILISQLEALFESFIELINIAIDGKSSYTGGHCQRVPVLTMMLAAAATRTQHGPLADFALGDKALQELKLAGLLHDCGKLTTPGHVVDKATKLQTVFDRIELVAARFEIKQRDATIAALEQKLAAKERAGTEPASAAAERELTATLAALNADCAFLRECNVGSESMTQAQLDRIALIAQGSIVDADGERHPLLTEDEVENLSIVRGTLTCADRDVINGHAAMTHKMLSALPWPKHLRGVPEIAANHHERLDGKGYPRGLSAKQMSLQARIVAIADVFEALTAKDRPYKPGKPLSESLHILGRMAQERHIDAALFDVFVRDEVYLEYAHQFLDPAQIDAVNAADIPGYTP